jgi:hypothetical protein
MPERLLKYRTASFIGFVGIFLFAMVGLARLPALGAAETLAHGLAWVGVVAAAVIMGRAWWNLAPEIFGGRMPLFGFVLLVFFVAWVWVWFAIVLVKCEGNLRTCGSWRLALDIGGLVMWTTLAWVVWWRTRGWVISLLLIAGSICTRLPIYVPSLPLGTRALGVIILSVGLIVALISLFRSAERRPGAKLGTHTVFAAGWFRLLLVVAAIGTLLVVSVPYLLSLRATAP